MRRMMMVSLAVLGLFMLSACSQESPPAANPAAVETRAVETPQAPAEELKQAVAEAPPKIEEAAASLPPVEAAEKQVKAVAQVKSEPVAVVAPVSLPEMVSYDASKGTIHFNHAAHAGRHACSVCHSTDPPQKITIDKVSGHALCKGCHQQSGDKAPKTCTGCHQK